MPVGEKKKKKTRYFSVTLFISDSKYMYIHFAFQITGTRGRTEFLIWKNK